MPLTIPLLSKTLIVLSSAIHILKVLFVMASFFKLILLVYIFSQVEFLYFPFLQYGHLLPLQLQPYLLDLLFSLVHLPVVFTCLSK